MRIGIDVRYLSHGLVGGLHQYVLHSVSALIELAREHQLFLYADTKRPFEIPCLPENVQMRYLPWRSAWSSVSNDLFMHRAIARDKLDVVHFPANYGFGPPGVPTVITIQDQINLLPMSELVMAEMRRGRSKNLRTLGMMTYLHTCTHAALRQADLITTVSAYSGKEVARFGRVPADKIVVVPSACPHDVQRIADANTLADVRERLGITRRFMLAEAFKNPATVVHAWKLLPTDLQQNLEIIFFSRSADVLPVVHAAIAAGAARLFVRPTRRDLSALYSMAEVFVFPSWIEGFGLPVLEAMTCGTPVIASDRGSIPEVAGDAALLVDAEDANALARHIERIMADAREAQQLRERGFARAALFSWRNNAVQMLKCYEQVARRN